MLRKLASSSICTPGAYLSYRWRSGSKDCNGLPPLRPEASSASAADCRRTGYSRVRALARAFVRAMREPQATALQYAWPEGREQLRAWIASRLRAARRRGVRGRGHRHVGRAAGAGYRGAALFSPWRRGRRRRRDLSGGARPVSHAGRRTAARVARRCALLLRDARDRQSAQPCDGRQRSTLAVVAGPAHHRGRRLRRAALRRDGAPAAPRRAARARVAHRQLLQDAVPGAAGRLARAAAGVARIARPR